MTGNMAKIKVIMILTTVVTTLLSCCSAFLLADNCPAPSPCTCSISSSSYIYVYCQSKSLKEIPVIKRSNNHVDTLNLHFSSNSLTVIHDNAFRNFSTINATNIDLQLNSNKIHTIGNNAFNGIENVTHSLYLSNNDLTTIPSAIGKLQNLQLLQIYNNPLHSIDPSVMPNIGRSLTSLYIDIRSFTEWPQEFHYLTVLQTLVARYIPFSHLDINVFHGFETTLTSLQIDLSKLEKITYAICHLSHLTHLYFQYDSHLKENRSSIFEPCAGRLSTVSYLHLQNNGLHVFPDVFTLFPSLTILNLNGNKLEYIESSKLPSIGRVTTIYLNNNLFKRIPPALNRLKSLKTLHIEHNNIKTIELADVSQLSMLTDLRLDSNPIVYISQTAFKHNLNLQTLDLRYTNLEHVPLAVTYLAKLRTLYFSGRPIDCTCDMSYLKHWKASAVSSFTTKCAFSTETIKTFVMNSLQSCP